MCAASSSWYLVRVRTAGRKISAGHQDDKISRPRNVLTSPLYCLSYGFLLVSPFLSVLSALSRPFGPRTNLYC